MLPRLRNETSAAHHRVEALLDLMSPAMDIERYGRVLQVFQSAWVPLEAHIAAFCPAEARSLWQGRERAHRLAADLESLGIISGPSSVPRAPLPDVRDRSAWLGALYVVEGSTLGGQVISRHLHQRFGWAEGFGHSFFLGHGAQTGERWRQVLQALQAADVDGNQTVRGAHQTFSYLEFCFTAGL
jgi:heme oxygenase